MIQDLPLVSVIMANYNTPIEYVQEAVSSILNQTYQNIELLFIDDKSTDKSAIDYVENLNDKRIILLKNEKNMGQPVTRNRGIKQAKGKYIAILDSDDIALPERIEKQELYMEEHPDVIVCGTWFERFGVENKIRKPIIDDFEEYRCQLLFCDTPICVCHSSAMMRKSMLDEHGLLYDEALINSQDYGMWVTCSKYGRIYILQEVLTRYRTHKKQISMKSSEQQGRYAELVSRRQLDALGIHFTEEERRWRHNQVTDLSDFNAFYWWLEAIKKANLEIKMFDQRALSSYMEKKAFYVIRRRKDQIRLWITSPLHIKHIMLKYYLLLVCKHIRKSCRG